MDRDNTPIFNVKNRKTLHFRDFLRNPGKEESELKKMDRRFKKNDLSIGQKEHDLKYNVVTHKYDDVTKDDTTDRIKAIEDLKKDESLNVLKFSEFIKKS